MTVKEKQERNCQCTTKAGIGYHRPRPNLQGNLSYHLHVNQTDSIYTFSSIWLDLNFDKYAKSLLEVGGNSAPTDAVWFKKWLRSQDVPAYFPPKVSTTAPDRLQRDSSLKTALSSFCLIMEYYPQAAERPRGEDWYGMTQRKRATVDVTVNYPHSLELLFNYFGNWNAITQLYLVAQINDWT